MSCLHVYNFLKNCSLAILILMGSVAHVQSQDIKKVDSLNERLSRATLSEKLEVLNELFKQYNQVDYKLALNYATEFDNLARQIGDSVKIVEGGRKIAYSLMDLGKNDEAIEILIKILGIAERNKEGFPEVKKQIKFILNNAGIAYNYLGNYDKALEYHYKSLLIREEEGDKKSIGTALNNLGMVFFDLKDPKKAIEYYQRAINSKREIGDSNDLDRILINLGVCYNQIGEFKVAIGEFDQGFAICGVNCTDNVKRAGLLGLGIANLGNKNLDKAEDCLLKSLSISKKQDNTLYQISNLYQLSLVEFARGNDEKGLKYLNEALALAEGSDFVEPLIQLYHQFAKVYNNKDNYEKTAYYLGKYTKLKDSIYSDELIKNLAKVQTNYAERENIKTIKEKDLVLVLKQELINRQKAQYIFIVAIAMLVLGLAAVLLWANNKQRRISAELSMAKRQLEERVLERTVELKKSNTMLVQTNEELDNFLYKTSHDIQGPLSTLKGLNNLAIIHSGEPTVVKDILEKLNTQIDKMNKILSRISVVSKINKTVLHAGVIDFKKMIDEIILFQERSGQLKDIKVIQEVEPNLNLISDPDFIRLILENLIDNSIKFFSSSQRIDPYVKIIVTKSGGDALILVEDNGIGIRYKSKEDIFHMFMRGSEKSEIGGVGLYLCKVSSDRIGGQIKLEDTSDSGTIFSVLLPLDITPLVVLNHKLEEERKHDKLKLA